MPERKAGKVSLVGAGPGDPGLLTLRAAFVLREADVLLYDALVSDAIVELAPASCERIFVGKRGGHHAMPQDEIEALAVERARSGQRVVRLKGGDPFVFGRGGEEAEALAAAGIPFEIVPGISSALAAPAYAGIPVTHREHNPAFTVATGHEDPTKSESTLDWSKLADPHRTLVFLMASGTLREIASRLVAAGLDASTPAAVVQDGTRPTQRTAVGTLATIADDMASTGIGPPAVVIVGSVVRLRERIAWFDREPLFGKRILVTRPIAQALDVAAALRARGAEPVVAPTIAIVPPDDLRPAHRAIDELAQYKWVVFTSRNGVEAFFSRLSSLDADTRYLGATKVAAIGSKTAQALQRFGVRPDLIPAEFVGEEIARALIEAARLGDRVLIYRAQEARDVLPQMLADAGLKTTVVAAYKTIFADDPEFTSKVGGCHAITFSSPSTIAGYSALLGGVAHALKASRGKTIVCIGPITAQAARDAGLHVDAVAREYTAEGVIAALESHFAPS
ncbi:MAG TPA: uroporphyrinogen-III C-methyltransferase [Candidatus Baltobacteraceae bacterium]|nr:uroporphyrinogen-III C-methyltransferase [Candidatus Baltobacteraceae bacterium]